MTPPVPYPQRPGDPKGGGMDPATLAMILSAGVNLFSNLFGPKPGQGYPTDTVSFTDQDTWKFLDNLLNTSGLVNTTGLTSTDQTGEVTPTMSPEAEKFMNQLVAQFATQARPVDIAGLKAQGIADINASGDLQRQAIDNIMASRGLSTSPVGATSAAMAENQRIGDINRFTSTLPLLQQELNNKNLAAAANFFSAIPKGQRSSEFGQTSQAGQRSEVGQQSQTQTERGTQSGRGYTFQGTLPTDYWNPVTAGRGGRDLVNPQPPNPNVPADFDLSNRNLRPTVASNGSLSRILANLYG